MLKIRKGDEVVVLVGKDKGRRGVVLDRVGSDRVLVNGINVVKKHARPNPAKNEAGGIVEKNMPIHISNVALFNLAKKTPERVGFVVTEDGKKVRVYRSSGEHVVSNSVSVSG